MSVELSGMAEWFLAVDGEKLGPVSRAEMEELVRLGGLDPRADMVWSEGMERWLPAGEIEGLFERRVPDEVEETPGMAATVTEEEIEEEEIMEDELAPPRFHSDLTRSWPGAGRGEYFLSTTVLPMIGNVALAFITSVVSAELAKYVPVLSAGFLIIAVYATMMRFSNLGMSRWWMFGLLVPVLNWWLGYRLFACPPGYVLTRKLDTLGWILAVLYWLMFVLVLAGAVALGVMMATGALSPETLRIMLGQPMPFGVGG